MDSGDISEDHPVRLECERRIPEVPAAYEGLDFAKAAESILAVSGRGNQYLEEAAPWALFKSEEEGDRRKAEETLVAILEALRVVAIALHPITPGLSARIHEQLARRAGAAGGGVGGNGGRTVRDRDRQAKASFRPARAGGGRDRCLKYSGRNNP